MRAWANLCTHRTKMTTFSSWVKASLKICSKMFPERFDKETMKQEQIVLERSTRLNLDPWPHASPYQRGVGSWCQTSDLTNFLALFRPVVMMTMKSLKSWYLTAPEKKCLSKEKWCTVNSILTSRHYNSSIQDVSQYNPSYRYKYRVSQNKVTKTKNHNDYWLRWSQIFPSKWLGSA